MPRKDPSGKMPLISIHLTKEMIEGLDWLVRRGVFPNRSEAVRAAILEFLENMGYLKGEKKEDDFPVLRGRW